LKLTKIKKTTNNNLKLYMESIKNIQQFANIMLAVTINDIITVHAKSSKIAVDDTGKSEIILTLTQEKDIQNVLALLSYTDDYMLYSTFTLDFDMELSLQFIKLDGKEYQYRENLYRHIFAIYSELSAIEKKPVDEIDKMLKTKLGLTSKKDCKIEELENYRNKISALLEEMRTDVKLETKWEDVMPY